MKRLVAVWSIVAIVACRTSPVISPSVDQQAEVRTIVAGFQDAWNRHDMDAFAVLFADDADFVNVSGVRWLGRDAIRDAHAATHATVFRNSRLTISETPIRFLKPDVAVARSVWHLTGQVTRTGESAPPRQGILTHVLVRSGGRWMIVLTQNTDIVQPGR